MSDVETSYDTVRIINPFFFIKEIGLDPDVKYHLVNYTSYDNNKTFNTIENYLKTVPIEKYYNIGDDIKLAVVPSIKMLDGRLAESMGYRFFVEVYLMSYEDFRKQVDLFLSRIEVVPLIPEGTVSGLPGVKLYTPHKTTVIPSRSLDTIWIDPKVKDLVVSEITKFFSDAEKEFYHSRGICHKKTYLFAGLPGTGKTNFARALATHFAKPIQTIDLSSSIFSRGIDPSMIIKKIESFIIIEDIDTMFQKMSDHGMPGSGPNISSIINMLDGIDSAEDIVTIITCNDSKILNLPSIRRGRINRVIEFGKMSQSLIVDMISSFFPDHNDRIVILADKLKNKQVLPCDLEAYILENIDSFDDFYNDITHNFKSSAELFKEAKEKNADMSQRYFNPMGLVGYN